MYYYFTLGVFVNGKLTVKTINGTELTYVTDVAILTNNTEIVFTKDRMYNNKIE